MNKRQRKKLARIRNDWYKGKKLYENNCPCCSWDALEDEEWKHHKILYSSCDYWGYIYWDFEVTCPYCKTRFEYSDSNM